VTARDAPLLLIVFERDGVVVPPTPFVSRITFCVGNAKSNK
jgi:hypothetical protein